MKHFPRFLWMCLVSAGPAHGRQIELVLVLDTTGSMSGLIERAKAELWGIVDQLSADDPSAQIRIGLVGFRDRGDEYVTQIVDLSSDIDASYGKMVGFRADGGGDTPESVNAALAVAVGQIAWSRGGNVDRAIVLAGDAPPHMDYAGETQWPASVSKALSRGIAIHAIQCGADPETRRVWQEIAKSGAGTYGALSSTPAEALGSPWDEQLAALNRALAATVVAFGGDAVRERVRNAADRTKDADSATAASRVSYLGRRGVAATSEDGDLVSKLRDGAVDWRHLKADELPDALRGLTPQQLRQYLEDQLGHRRGLLSEVAYYAKKRDAYLEDQRAKDPAAAFQRRVVEALGPGHDE